MGRKTVAAKCLEYLLTRRDVQIVGVLTDSHLPISPTARIAEDHGLRLYDFDSALSDLKVGALNFDLGLSVLYWRKLKEEFLTVPSSGIINFHPAPLPLYKGTAGYNLAILDKCDHWATSAHYVDDSIDTGAIIDVSSFEIDPDRETALSIEVMSQLAIKDQFQRVVNLALSIDGCLSATPNLGGKYTSRIEMEELKKIKTGDDISRKIRAFWFPPYDGAYIVLDGVKYTLVDRFLLESLADASSSSLFMSQDKV